MACKSLDHIQNATNRSVQSFEDHKSTGSQAVLDIAVVVLSFMTREEIETAMYMSMGSDGVAELVASTLEAKKPRIHV